MGDRNKPIDIESVLVANGFGRVYHVNPLEKDSSIVAVKAAVSYKGPSAVIFEAPCIQLTKPSAPVTVNPDVCTGCKKCITEIGCPAIGFNPSLTGMRSGKRGQAYIDDALCNGCDLCTQVCPFKAISVPLEPVAGTGSSRASASGVSRFMPDVDPATIGSTLPAALLPKEEATAPAVEAEAEAASVTEAAPVAEVATVEPADVESDGAQEAEEGGEPVAEAPSGKPEAAEEDSSVQPSAHDEEEGASPDGEQAGKDAVILQPVLPDQFATVLLQPVRESVQDDAGPVAEPDAGDDAEPVEEPAAERDAESADGAGALPDGSFEEGESKPDAAPADAEQFQDAWADAVFDADVTVAIDPVNVEKRAVINQMRDKIMGFTGENEIDPSIFSDSGPSWNSWRAGNWDDVPYEGEEDA